MIRKLPLLLVIASAAGLAACGSRNALKPSEGASLPVAPYGAQARPTPSDLLDNDPQTRPRRSDELLKESKEREPDPFDLPPG